MILDTLPLLGASALLLFVIHHRFFHPLRHVPGPFYVSVSPLFLYVICYLGIEGHVLRSLHRRHRTPVLRVGPNSVSISDSSTLRDIYITNGGFPKDARYRNFNLGPIVSIFSAIDPEYRDQRAKAVAPLFAPARVRSSCAPNQPIGQSIAQFMRCLSTYQVEKIPFDLVDLCARLSIDVVTEYLLGKPYGGFAEIAHLSPPEQQSTKLSANPFIFAIVGFSRFSLLPNWLFQQVYRLAARLTLTEEAIQSFHKLDTFATQVMPPADSAPPTTTYQSRLLSAGISPTETAAQCKAIVFAGADSTAVMLTTILFHLIRNEDARHTLAAEINAHRQKSPVFDPESVPYLRAVVKEGLRLGMANPTRLTRAIPPSTYLQVGGYTLPPGTVVGCAAYTLHHDPEVFPEPFEFRPERWLEGGKDAGLGRPNMERNMMPFGVGLRACIGKNLALRQLYETVSAVVSPLAGGDVLQGARMKQDRIEMIEWFNGEIRGHCLDVVWE
ncbi:cytochrome P450 [Aspergillus pseudotamarii]|uniref:Cytochrome P450 n=1 Tax=Aspergillus pseudotamarii TaxID=132259 RepID=A0A5N6SS41_ASPPS|nr:cytochrome P450 [Aspergillus pseudotamarii]KAE8137488.1 cytochrome P450 [Aspergillus pseudotamarii]